LRREFEVKAAADKAAMEKALAQKLAAEKEAGEKLAAARSAQEKAAAEKAAQKAQAERLAAEKAAAERAAAEKVAAEKASAAKAAADKAAVEKAAAEKAAAAKAAAEKAAEQAARKPGWPAVGDRWVYDLEVNSRAAGQLTIVATSVGATGIAESQTGAQGGARTSFFNSTPEIAGNAPGLANFMPYLSAFLQPRAGHEWSKVAIARYANCFRNGNECTANAKIKGRERVTVKAGSFDAWVIVVGIDIAGIRTRSVYREHTYWYAEEVGRFVKQRSVTLAGNTNSPDSTLELASYNRAGR